MNRLRYHFFLFFFEVDYGSYGLVTNGFFKNPEQRFIKHGSADIHFFIQSVTRQSRAIIFEIGNIP